MGRGAGLSLQTDGRGIAAKRLKRMDGRACKITAELSFCVAKLRSGLRGFSEICCVSWRICRRAAARSAILNLTYMPFANSVES